MRLETLNLEMTIDLWRIVSHGFDTNKMPLWETWTRHKLSTSLCAWARAGRELWARNGRPSKNVNHCPSICCRFFFLLRTFQCFFLVRLSKNSSSLELQICRGVALRKNNRISNFTCVCVREDRKRTNEHRRRLGSLGRSPAHNLQNCQFGGRNWRFSFLRMLRLVFIKEPQVFNYSTLLSVLFFANQARIVNVQFSFLKYREIPVSFYTIKAKRKKTTLLSFQLIFSAWDDPVKQPAPISVENM